MCLVKCQWGNKMNERIDERSSSNNNNTAHIHNLRTMQYLYRFFDQLILLYYFSLVSMHWYFRSIHHISSIYQYVHFHGCVFNVTEITTPNRQHKIVTSEKKRHTRNIKWSQIEMERDKKRMREWVRKGETTEIISTSKKCKNIQWRRRLMLIGLYKIYIFFCYFSR